MPDGELWRLPSGTRCVLHTTASGPELLLIAADGVAVIRRAAVVSAIGIENVAEYWRREFMTIEI